MDGRRGHAIAAATLLVGLSAIAGCSAVGWLGGSPPTATPTGSFVAAPGIEESGIADFGRLRAAHRASLQDTSYTLRTEVVVLRANGTERARRTSVLRVDAARERLAFDRQATGTFPESIRPQRNRSAWSGGGATYVRIEDREGWAYARYEGDVRRSVVILDGHEAIGIYLAGLENATVEEVTADGWIAYRVSSTAPDGTATVAVIDSFGLLRSLEAIRPAAEVFWLHGEATAVRRLTYERIGNTTIGRPAWVDEAIVATGRPNEAD